MIELREVSLTYPGPPPVTVLEKVTLTVESGQFVALVGASGSGKTTLLNMLGGLDQPTGGSLVVDGLELTSLSDQELSRYRREKVGFIFQSFHLHPHRTALQNVSIPLYFGDSPLKAGLIRSRELLKRFGLEGLEHRPVSALSGGQRQRVAVARALVNQPQLVLADEPVGSLDQESAKLVVELLHHIQQHDKVTVITATHDEILTEKADRIFEVRAGQAQERVKA